MEIFWLKANAKKRFYFLAGINRPITPNQVTKLAASILMMGIIRPIVIAELSFITGVKQKYIVDGQHLYNACLRLGINIPYIIVTVKNQEELIEKIALLNASSKSWTQFDYLTDVLKIIPRMNRIDNKYACSEYLSFLSKVGSKYDHSKFIAKLLKIKDSFVFATQEPGVLETTFKQLL
jgi:hypothetical protein